ncbi:MAG: response regulator [Saprospiraceae bacterium]|nr:response regulator [Saprospiraceae bacterium]
MNTFRVMIVEDEPLVAFDLKMQLEKTGLSITHVFESGEEILEVLKSEVPDLILMDVQLQGSLDGIDTAHEINRKYDIPILFLTANTDKATFDRAKLTFPHGFLSKPFRIKDVLHAIDLTLELEKSATENTSSEKYLADRVFIRTNDYLEKVMYSDILFIEADGAYAKIVTEVKTFILSQTLKKIQSKIPAPYLMKVHRSFAINTEKVDKISDSFVLIGNHKIPVSRTYRDALFKIFNIF